jgi:transcriptional regulator with XRE-family HTH domain
MWIKDLGIVIKQRRNALKITQPHLAELAKISVNTLYKIERGEGNPTIDVLEKIAEVLGLQLKLEVKKTNL